MESIDRRQVLLGAVVVAGAAAVAACSTSVTTSSASSSSAAASDSPSGASSGGSSSSLATTTDVPVGGGVIVESAGQAYAVTQPTSGTFACFSAVCPHQGCNCNQVADGTIDCPCHGSTFSIATGEVMSGPATSGLTPAPITVTGTDITLA